MYGETGLKLIQNAKRAQTLPQLPAYQADLIRQIVREVRDLERANQAILTAVTSEQQQQSQSTGDHGQFSSATATAVDPMKAPEKVCMLLINHMAIRRNKRCLLAYERMRAFRIEQMCWAGLDSIDIKQQTQATSFSSGYASSGARAFSHMPGDNHSADAPGSNASNLSPEEEEYVIRYSDLVASFKAGVGSCFNNDDDNTDTDTESDIDTDSDESDINHDRNPSDILDNGDEAEQDWADFDLTGSLEPPTNLFVDVRVVRDAGEIQTEYSTINLTKNSQIFVRFSDVERLIQQGYLQRL